MSPESTGTSDPRPILVTGATGRQGGAVARRLLRQGHQVRALTRDPAKHAAKSLAAAGAEVVAGDMDDRNSLDAALADARAVFSVQNFWEAGYEAEVRQGLNLTDAAVAAGVEHLVYSGVASADRNTGIPHFESKWEVEQHVRSSGVPWTVLRPAAFMDDWELEREAIFRDGVIALPLEPKALYRQVAVEDIAAFAVMALEGPKTWIGRVTAIAGDDPTPVEVADTFSRVTGRPVRYERMSWDDCRQQMGEELTVMFRYFNDVGMDADPYTLRRWHAELLTLEQYLRAHGWGSADRRSAGASSSLAAAEGLG